jgi:hypothetical protein
MAELVGIRVLIKRVATPTGSTNLYPNLNRVPAVIRNSLDWSAYIDTFGSGWHYDQVAPFGQTDPESPNSDEMFGIIGVPEDFARAAVELFPVEIQTVTSAEFTSLFENRTKTTAPDTLIDSGRLTQLRALYGITGPIDDPAAIAIMSPEDRRAVDPLDPAPGIVNNANKTLARYTAKVGHTIRMTPDFATTPGKGKGPPQ